ncbi:MAG: tetratricopeptide repeat protein [Candidatus Riflebacteria bacterium]|nr:tetratricopeptide repeat protein [Candidatus Riflebacteria bacterium]
MNLAEVFMEMGRYNRARPLLEANLEILRVVRAERHVASTLLKIGILELESGSLKRAASALDEALDCFVRVEDEHGMAGVQVAQATLLHRTGNRAGARVLMEGLLVEARREGSALDVADILYRLASQALEEGDLETARTRAGEAARAFDAVGRQRFAERMRALLIRVAFVAGELAVADELASEEVAEARARSDPRGLAMALTLLAEVRLDQCRVDEAFRLTTEALRLRQRSGDQRGLVASYRLLADLLIQPGASRADRVKAQRLVSRGLELAQQQGVAVERAHLHLLQGVLSLSVGRPQEALSHAEELRLTSEGLSDLGVLSLKLAQEACASLGDLDRQGRYRDAWVEQMSQRSHPRARRLFDVTARLGLDSSPSCEWRAAGRSALVSVDRALLVETHTVDLTVDRVNLRLLFRNRAPIDLAARPQVLDLLDAVASSATRRLPVARLEKRFGRNVAHVVDQLNATVASSGRPVLRVSGDGGRVELCADLRVGVIVPRSGREQRKTRTSPPAD